MAKDKQTNLLDQQSGLASAHSAPAAQGPPAPVAGPGVASANGDKPTRSGRKLVKLSPGLQALADLEEVFGRHPAYHEAMLRHAAEVFGKKEVAPA